MSDHNHSVRTLKNVTTNYNPIKKNNKVVSTIPNQKGVDREVGRYHDKTSPTAGNNLPTTALSKPQQRSL